MIEAGSLSAMASAFFLIAIAPGPATLGCASVSMAHGRRAGLGFGLGLSVGLAVWGIVAAAGLGAVLVASERLLVALKLLGGVYLLWLAWQSGRRAAARDVPVRAVTGQGRWIWRGLILNLSNPKAVLAWLAVLAIGTGPNAGAATVALATAICALIGFLIYLPWIFGFSHPRIMAVYARARRWVDGVVAALFATAGLGLIRSALARS